ncbi:hypothetical protein BHM03_00009109 [Ensete ventricosum]|nr:hypothetical protein BHM03_00009109 [Ensete ventricosum]
MGRIFQGKEPPQFIALFQPMVVLKVRHFESYRSMQAVRINLPADCGKTCTARYIPVRQLTGMRTGRYRAVPLRSVVGSRFRSSTVDFRRRWSISAVCGRFKEKSIVGGRLRKKKERRRRGKEEEEEKYLASPQRRVRPGVACAPSPSAGFFLPARNVSPRGREFEATAVRIAPFSNRLAHSVPSSIQGLRCLTNYEALRFSKPIRSLAERMVHRMVNNSSINGGKYISVHLRFEEVLLVRSMSSSSLQIFYCKGLCDFCLFLFQDMVAFSCCTYDGGQQEKNEMDKARERSWRGKFRRPGRVISPEANRRNGKCPLTPLERSPNSVYFKSFANLNEVLHHSDLKGITLRKPDASLYTFPMPDCMCQQAEA